MIEKSTTHIKNNSEKNGNGRQKVVQKVKKHHDLPGTPPHVG
jgi:hypothetical protein